jgi:hypothetical protein
MGNQIGLLDCVSLLVTLPREFSYAVALAV